MTENGLEESFGGDGNVLELILVMVVQLCDYNKSH